MIHMLKLRLILHNFLPVFFVFCIFSSALAQDWVSDNDTGMMANQPPEAVQSEEIEWIDESQGIVFIELFSSQACVFCPQADRLFKSLLDQDNVMGISCHIDYFDVRESSLSRDFCTKRQNWYMEVLTAGPNYIPQMVMNGRHDVIGHKVDEVANILKNAKGDGVLLIEISVNEYGEGYVLSFPDIEKESSVETDVWLALYDRKHDLTIEDGRNKGKDMNYVHIVSTLENIGDWNGMVHEKIITPETGDAHEGFVVWVQDRTTGHIFASGEFIIHDDNSLQN